MDTVTPTPESLDELMINQIDGASGVDDVSRRDAIRAENAVAVKYWGEIQYRIIVTFVFFAVCWMGVVVLTFNGTLNLWQGLILNSLFATTFYMPLHEATHKNIWGKNSKGRWVEDLIGVLCSIPTGLNFTSHRAGHMRHHAFTNDPTRDPDHFTEGRLRDLPLKMYGITLVYSLMPFFALMQPLRVMLPKSIQNLLANQVPNVKEGRVQLRFWFLSTAMLVVGFVSGFGWQLMMLWWIPARIQLCWLLFIFAWFPHHPAGETSRYRHTRIAVFRGSGFLIRGHDHHAMHHLYPRVPHYKLKALWRELADDLVQRGVRAEGLAVGATQPVVW